MWYVVWFNIDSGPQSSDNVQECRVCVRYCGASVVLEAHFHLL